MNANEPQSEPSGQTLPIGTQLMEFVIEKVLGSGGFGITYLARDTSLGRQVVVKENLPAQFCFRDNQSLRVSPRHTAGGDAEDFEWSLQNFLREADTLASLDHPGIVRVLRKFEANGTAYFVMPFVKGVEFGSLIARRSEMGPPFTEEELRGLLERMLDALGYLHDRGIYHRDIKPANILITTEGVPTLIDFGSARQNISERSLTVIESAGYTPFEQLQSRGNVGPWSDLYALGATVAKAVTFETPPKAADRMMGDPWSGLARNPAYDRVYSEPFLRALDRAMAVDPRGRWQSAGEWLKFSRSEGVHGSAFAVPPRHPQSSSQTPPPLPSAATFANAPPVPSRSILVKGSYVYLPESCNFPVSHCICCGKPTFKTYKKYYESNPYRSWAAVCWPLLILSMFYGKGVSFLLPFGLCRQHAKSYHAKNIVCNSPLITVPVFFIVLPIIGNDVTGVLSVLLGILAFSTSMVFWYLPRPVKISGPINGYFKLRGVSDSFKRLLENLQ